VSNEVERRGGARRLGEATAHLQTLVQELPQGVLVVDSAGKLLLANRRAEEIIGVPFSEIDDMLRNEPWALFTPDGRRLADDERPLRRVLAHGTPTLHETFFLERRDGTRRFVEISAVAVSEPGGVRSAVVTYHDVTDRKTRERAERDFVTNAAHELQTPLAAITSAVEVLRAGAKDDPAELDRFLMHIANSCDRLNRLTRALLVLARAQTSKEAPRREVVAIEPLLHSVADGLHHDAVIEIEIECALDLAVVTNRVLLEQALANLGQNAIKHTRGPVTLRAIRSNGRVEIAVQDSGRGIAPADRPRVFERFYRRGEPGAGFGLGLAIVSEAVHALEGELTLDTSERGTTVTIALPGARMVDA
jgi:PAS domain S-box-containing protein